MNRRNDGGPAFPMVLYQDGREYTPGMTLRDYFAAKAMQAYIAAWVSTNKHPEYDSVTALAAYKAADAMLAERAK